ncbi:MAG: hypothetical protein OXH50_04515 [Gemmatimonadetes bacterium]|nr:hypothetical protein [Gemmatimonadota bacterium]
MNKILIIMAMTAMAEAHSGTRLYPFYQLTDEMLEEIDLHDGSIDEWYEVGEPSMTLLDFKAWGGDLPHDPSNLDFRVWLAWQDEPDRVYAAFIIADDVFRNHNYTEGSWPFAYDSIVFQIDADHRGGQGEGQWYSPSREQLMEVHGDAQRYSAVARTASGPILDDGTWWEGEGGKSWRVYPPYGDAGGVAAGENPTISVIELYVTPFDEWGDNVEETLFSDLSAHQIVGFSVEVIEQEEDPSECGCSGFSWYPAEMEGQVWLDLLDSMADLYVDGLLLPPQDTAVESMTWGRIKASLK